MVRGYVSRQVLLHNLSVAARALGLHCTFRGRADELDTSLCGAAPGMRTLLVMEDALVLNTLRGRVVAALAAKSRLPVMYSWREWVVADAHGLGPSLQETFRRTATYVDKILKARRPPTCPWSSPRSSSWSSTSRLPRLGLTI